MNNGEQPITTTQVPSKKSKINTLLLLVLGLMLLGIVGYGSYTYGSRNSKSATAQSSANNQRISNNSKQVDNAAATSFHTVVFGSLAGKGNVSIKLAFPQDYQAIAHDNGPDSFRSLFGDDSGNINYHGGSWEIGNPADVYGNTWGNIGIMGIAPDWYGRNSYATYGGFNGDSYTSLPEHTTINGYDFSTAQHKQESLKKLVSDTSNCAKDPAKGLTISGVFNVCYTPTMIRQAYAAYHPRVDLSGYASINNVPYVLFGYVDIKGGLDGYKDDALNKAGDDFLAGKIPSPTQKNIDSFIAAFKHSSIDARKQ